MAIKSCRECGGQVSTEAIRCPHCGVTSPASFDSKSTPPVGTAKKGIALWKKVLIGFGIVWAIGVIAQVAGRREAKPVSASTSSAPTNDPQAAPPSTSGQKGGPQCFNKGDAIATVYLANIKQAIDVGMLASEMMDQGCRKSVGSQGQDCIDECKLGFRAKAKQWVKDGSLN